MSEESFQEKTEPASPRKRAEARKQGNVARSMELNSALVLLAGMIALRIFGGDILNTLKYVIQWAFSNLAVVELTVDNFPDYALSGLTLMGVMLSPVVFIVLIAGVGSSFIQGGVVLTGEPLQPKFSKINPVTGFKRIFSMKALVDLAKNIMKLVIIGTIGYVTLKKEIAVIPYLVDRSVLQILDFVGKTSFVLGMRIGIALLILAGFDFWYQKFEFDKKLKMTKQEVRDEFKRMEGDPHIKSKIRSIQREQARKRMYAAVAEADVVLTNPTHLAVALKYDSEVSSAPILVAKGARLMAERIKQIAREHNVPVIENKPLARLLYKTTEIGSEIPYEIYRAVAEILAYVYRLKRKV